LSFHVGVVAERRRGLTAYWFGPQLIDADETLPVPAKLREVVVGGGLFLPLPSHSWVEQTAEEVQGFLATKLEAAASALAEAAASALGSKRTRTRAGLKVEA